MFQDQDQKAFRLASQSLRAFTLLMIPGYEVAPHHQLIIDKIELLLSGKIKRLAVITPPRHGKSLLCSVALPAYFLGQNPKAHVICASYGAELSESWGRRVRGLLQDENFQKVFPKCILSPDSQAAGRFDTTRGGQYVAAGVRGPLTGRGADLLVLDDLIKDAQEANSDVTCRSIIEWLRFVALTRLSRHGKVLAISTRWSERDPMGFLLREMGWEVLHLPAISEGAGDPLRRPEGAALWEAQYPKHVLENIRVAIGPSAWQSLYQGNPTAAQGQIFRRIWFRRYQVIPDKFEKIVMSLDTAFKTGAANDYSVATVWGMTSNGFYLLHMWRDRCEFPALKEQVVALAESWRPHAILVEDRASGQSLIQELKNTALPILPVKADADKTTRANAVTAFFAAGKVYFPDGAAWTDDVETELSSFPQGVHDDIVDSLTQALNYLRGDNLILGLVEWVKMGNPSSVLAMDPEPSRGPVGVEPVAAPGSAFSPAGSCGPPSAPARQKAYEPCRCGGELEILNAATNDARCTRCGASGQAHERSPHTPVAGVNCGQNRGEYLRGQERQPNQFGRGLRQRFLAGRSGR